MLKKNASFRFEISDESGDTLDDKQMMQIHYDRITSLQRAMFAKYPENPEMRKFALSTVASIDDQENLAKHFKGLKTEMLYEIAEYLFLVPRGGDKENELDIKAKVNFSPMSPKLLLTFAFVYSELSAVSPAKKKQHFGGFCGKNVIFLKSIVCD